MANDHETDDAHAIRAIIDRQFRSLEWSGTRSADWPTFVRDFHPAATLYPAARPVTPKSVDAFAERMKGLAQQSLLTFAERMLGAEIHVYGNVATAMAACEITENGEKITRSVEAMLLIKEDGYWKIVAQGWDAEREENPIPTALISERPDQPT